MPINPTSSAGEDPIYKIKAPQIPIDRVSGDVIDEVLGFVIEDNDPTMETDSIHFGLLGVDSKKIDNYIYRIYDRK